MHPNKIHNLGKEFLKVAVKPYYHSLLLLTVSLNAGPELGCCDVVKLPYAYGYVLLYIYNEFTVFIMENKDDWRKTKKKYNCDRSHLFPLGEKVRSITKLTQRKRTSNLK